MPELYDGPIIDSHHHVWDLDLGRHPWLAPGARVAHRYGDYEPIKRDYLPADYLRDIAGTGVIASVYMEAEWVPGEGLDEVRAVERYREESGVPGSMVAQAWLDAPDAADRLAELAAVPTVKSVRHKPGGAASPAEAAAGVRSLLSDDAWRDGYARLAGHGLHFDLQTPWWNLDEARRLADDVPETTLVIDHAGVLADRDDETVAAWRAALERIAEAPNVVIKASGLCVAGTPWTVQANRGPIETLVHVFGAERVMFGSNFPVDGMFIDYPGLVDGYREILSTFDADAQRAVFHDTAQRVYAPRPLPDPSS
ncbi:amidohydrolase family protein [Microbacterium sp. C5A9]|uniref:amidohydrolase family protein n=1 Tax=Microbacterium sp. C5A9 TaxID=2736663 RepID=UPI001F519CD1|nr:amidohydrolase family protein [Microbacterium sp. C5A9]MCI1018969.1 amidohydrolase family protein [Microbacterium sp. C5A9]